MIPTSHINVRSLAVAMESFLVSERACRVDQTRLMGKSTWLASMIGRSRYVVYHMHFSILADMYEVLANDATPYPQAHKSAINVSTTSKTHLSARDPCLSTLCTAPILKNMKYTNAKAHTRTCCSCSGANDSGKRMSKYNTTANCTTWSTSFSTPRNPSLGVELPAGLLAEAVDCDDVDSGDDVDGGSLEGSDSVWLCSLEISVVA